MKVFKTRGRAGPRDAALRASRIIAGGAAGAFVALLMFGTDQAQAARHLRYHAHARHGAVGFGPVRVSESIVIDADTGQVLGQMNADAITYPASLTKMMTLYLTFEALNAGKLQLNQYLPVSAEAANKSPTKLHLLPGDSVQVQDLILGVVTRSANDAAAVLAEGMAGSEWAFAERMTQKAGQLGMTTTVYRNASGLPDPEQYTTARDVAQLALALYHDFPREYRYFATRQFYFRGNFITNHNRLLEWYEGADGIKTGYIGASGFNLAASAVRNGHRLIGVIMGGPSAGARDRGGLYHPLMAVRSAAVCLWRQASWRRSALPARPRSRREMHRAGCSNARSLARRAGDAKSAQPLPWRSVRDRPRASARLC